MRLTTLLVACVVASPAAAQPVPKNVYPFQMALDISADGGLVATCGDKVRVYELASGKPLREFDSTPSRSLAFSPAAEHLLAVGGEDGSVRLYDAGKGGEPRELKGHIGWVFSLAFDKTGKWLAVTSHRFEDEAKKIEEAGQFRLWDVDAGKIVKTIDVKGGRASAAAFSDDGTSVAFCRSGPGDAGATTLDVFRADPWEAVASVKLPAGGLKGTPFGTATRFLPGGKRLMIAGGVCVPLTAAEVAPYTRGCSTRGLLWQADLGDKPAAKLLEEPRLGYFSSLSLSPDGKRYTTNSGIVPRGGSGSRVEVRGVEGGKTLWQAADGPGDYGVRFTPDGKFVTCIRSGSIQLYDAANGNPLRLIPVGP